MSCIGAILDPQNKVFCLMLELHGSGLVLLIKLMQRMQMDERRTVQKLLVRVQVFRSHQLCDSA